MQYRTCYRCPIKSGCLYIEHVIAAVKNAPVVFTSVSFKCDYKKGHVLAGTHVIVSLPNVAVLDQELVPYRFNAVVMRWKGRKVQVWLIEPDCGWPEQLQAKQQVVSVWPDQVCAIETKKGTAQLCAICRKPFDQPVTRGDWKCECVHGVKIDKP